MKFAVIKTGGKQYRVAEGDTLKVEKLPAAVGEKIVFDQVFLTAEGDQVEIGTPVLAKAKVESEVLEQDRPKKLLAFKYKAKTRYRIKRGHRQPYTKVKITKLGF